MTRIIDTNQVASGKLSGLKGLGIETIIRYLSPINPTGAKSVKAAEARAIAAAGMRLGLVCEGWGGAGDFEHHDINAMTGKRDAEWCRGYAVTVGAPEGACIYFAVDTDASVGEINVLVLPYFKAVKEVFDRPGAPKYAIGVYGSGAVCSAVLDAGLANLSWLSQSMGWTGSRAYRASKRWALLQGPVTPLAGLDTDTDEANGAFGDFVPFAGQTVPINPPVAPPADRHDAFWLQRRLNELGAAPQLHVDGDIGPMTVGAVEKYLPPEGAKT